MPDSVLEAIDNAGSYVTNLMKNKKNNPDRIEMSKYCKFCKKHTAHKETK